MLGGRYLAPMTLGKLQAMHEARKDKTDAYNPDNWQRDLRRPKVSALRSRPGSPRWWTN